MKKAIIVGISLTLLILLTPVKTDNSQIVSATNIEKSKTTILYHPILPPVG
ncbi:hypothetical protein V7111_03595 [Neobacillus niacini]|uniref:hypothetical protein n=1 Tax=Neobacillus niacini TaxID=86668 RepID=UPI002FFF0011